MIFFCLFVQIHFMYYKFTNKHILLVLLTEKLCQMMELREAIAEADDSKELNQIQSQVPFEHPDSSAFLQTLLVTFLKLGTD